MNVAYLRLSEQFPEALAAAGRAVTALTRLDALTRNPEPAEGILVGGDDPDAIEEAILPVPVHFPFSF